MYLSGVTCGVQQLNELLSLRPLQCSLSHPVPHHGRVPTEAKTTLEMIMQKSFMLLFLEKI